MNIVLGITGGIGASGGGEEIPDAIHIPFEFSVTVHARQIELETYARLRWVADDGRSGGGADNIADEFVSGFAVRVPWIRTIPIMLGASYQQFKSDRRFGLLLGTRR